MSDGDESPARPQDWLSQYDLVKQQTAFCVITLFVLATLLLMHTLFASALGKPSLTVVAILGFSFVLRLFELAWLQHVGENLSQRAAMVDGALSIITLLMLGALLAWLTDRDYSPYQVLLEIPILQSACLFGLASTLLTIAAADVTIFWWLQYYLKSHPQSTTGEYLEAGMLAVAFALTGVVMWIVMRLLRNHQSALANSMADLEATRARLASREKLAAVGRLASGIAHEIRNPVAMISSSLATAAYPNSTSEEREEMFSIAAREARRLERLTGDFLTYARPAEPQRSMVDLEDILRHIADVSRMRVAGRRIEVTSAALGELQVDIDPTQVEAALLNLCLNAIDATPDGGRIALRAGNAGDTLRIEVENSGAQIAPPDLLHIFEPFFTTKANGTGLGLAIARSVALTHGGDLWVSRNEHGCIVFTMTIGVENGKKAGALDGESTNR